MGAAFVKETGREFWCFECGRIFDWAYANRREALTQVRAFHSWFRSTPFDEKTYEKVFMCPGCAAHVDEIHAKRRRVMGVAAAVSAVLLFGWGYFGFTVGAGAAAVGLTLFLLPLRRKKTTILPVERS